MKKNCSWNMLKLSLDNKVGTKMVKEVVDILTQEAEISLRLEGTMFRVIKTTMLHWRTRILLPKNIVQIMLKIMVSLLVKFLGNQITLLLIVGIDLIIHINQKISLKPLLPLLSMIKLIGHSMLILEPLHTWQMIQVNFLL